MAGLIADDVRLDLVLERLHTRQGARRDICTIDANYSRSASPLESNSRS
jgi:hypothetical protein